MVSKGLIVDRSSVDTILLEVAVCPDVLEDEAVQRLLSDPGTRELGHGILELATKLFPGSSEKAIEGFRGTLLGAAFVVETLRIQDDMQVTS